MIILNHPILPAVKLCYAKSQAEIEAMSADVLVILCNDLELARFCFDQEVAYGYVVFSIQDALLLVNLGVKYLLCKKRILAKELQRLAEYYLFDAKILYLIYEHDEIELLAKDGIDGVLYLPPSIRDSF